MTLTRLLGTVTSRLSTGRSPLPSPDITTASTGLLCWRDLHPQEWQLASLHPLGTSLEISPCQVAQRLLGRGNEALRTQAVQIERRLARAGFLHAHEPFQIIGEAKPGWIIGQLRIKQRECALPAHPELPFVVVRILVLILLDRYRAIWRRPGEFRIDLVTSGWTSRL